jgi:hypothetical protein
MLVRRAVKNDLRVIPAAKRLQDELLSPAPAGASTSDGAPLDDEMRLVAAFKKVALMVLGTAMQTYGEKLTDEQEVLSYTADILIERLRGRERRAPCAGRSRRRLSFNQAAAQLLSTTPASAWRWQRRSAPRGDGRGRHPADASGRAPPTVKPALVNTVALRRILADATVSSAGISLIREPPQGPGL